MAFVARNGIYLTRSGLSSNLSLPPDPKVDYGGLVQAIASGEMRFASASNMQLYSSMKELILGAGATPNVITISSNAVVINADVRVKGSVDSYTSTEVNLVDKVVRVAYPQPLDAVVDAASLDGAGLALADTSMSNYEKSVKWRSGQGADAVTATDQGSASNESHWELVGGHLRLTARRRSPNSGTVSYGMRINEREELEFYKMLPSVGPVPQPAVYQRVFTVGGDTMGPGFTLPKSKNHLYNA
jgi:hypothetical protein